MSKVKDAGIVILAIDTSADFLSIAILKGRDMLARFHRKSGMRHSILLVPTIDKLLKRSKIQLKGIDCFAVSIGPGSFTGLRIGVTVIKGLSYALKKPVVAVPTLDAIAWNAIRFKGIICPVLDARKNKVYACIYRSDGRSLKRLTPYLLLPPAELLEKMPKHDKVFFLGNYRPGLEINLQSRPVSKVCAAWHPKADVVARLGAEYFKKKRFVKAMTLEPMYLYSRECDVTGR